MTTQTDTARAITGSGSTKSGSAILKLCAWAGPAWLIALGLGFGAIAGFIPPPREHWAADEIAAFYRDNEVRITLGMEIMLAFCVLYYPWSVAIARVMERTEGHDSPLVRIQLFGGLTSSFIAAVSALGFVIAAFRADVRDPADIQLINDVAWLFFNLLAMFTAIQMVAMSIAWLRAGERAVMPRWLAYLGIWVAFSFVVVFLIPFAKSGPFAWHGAITFWFEFSAFFWWMVPTCYYLIRAVNNPPEEAPAA